MLPCGKVFAASTPPLVHHRVVAHRYAACDREVTGGTRGQHTFLHEGAAKAFCALGGRQALVTCVKAARSHTILGDCFLRWSHLFRSSSADLPPRAANGEICGPSDV